MPIYEYHCDSCGKDSEALQKINEPPLTECPHCKTKQLKRLISASGFQLKGSGWYVTDFKDPGKKPKAKGEDNTKKDDKKAATASSTESSKQETKDKTD